MEKLCKNCKWWFSHHERLKSKDELLPTDVVIDENDEWFWPAIRVRRYDPDQKFGQCFNPLIQSDTVSGWEKREPLGEENLPSYGIISECDEQRGHLQVGRDFGCIHWQAKE